MAQLSHEQTQFESKQFPISIVTDGLQSPANIGGILRLMEAFGVGELFLCESAVDLNSSRLKRTARSAERAITIHSFDTTLNALEHITNKAPNTQIIALEITTNSIPLAQLDLDSSAPIALILGGESQGVSSAVLARCHLATHIPMYGNNSSMNVAQATAIALYSISQQLL